MNAILLVIYSSWVPRLCWFCTALSLPLLTGCATPELWSRTNYCPAIPAQIQLSERDNDILVQYRERSTAWPRPRSRRFYLMQNADRLSQGQPPVFVHRAAGRPIPIFDAATPLLPSSPVPPTGYYARLAGFASDFELYHDGGMVGHFSLPIYEDYSNPASMRILLAPFTVTFDAVTVAGFLCLYASGPALSSMGSGCSGGGHSGGLVAVRH